MGVRPFSLRLFFEARGTRLCNFLFLSHSVCSLFQSIGCIPMVMWQQIIKCTHTKLSFLYWIKDLRGGNGEPWAEIFTAKWAHATSATGLAQKVQLLQPKDIDVSNETSIPFIRKVLIFFGMFPFVLLTIYSAGKSATRKRYHSRKRDCVLYRAFLYGKSYPANVK